MKRTSPVLFGLILLGMSLRLSGGESAKAPVQTTTTELVSLASGGVIRLDHSAGYLTIEGWDRPEVEVTVTKSSERYYAGVKQRESSRLLDRIRVVTERRSEEELLISTRLNHRFLSVSPLKTRGGVTVEYQIHAPRDARLVVRHDGGSVLLSGLTGEIEAANHSGDIMLMLPGPGPYTIDAKSKVGSVSSDVGDSGRRWYLAGERLARASAAPLSRRIYLRVLWGSITIKQLPPASVR